MTEMMWIWLAVIVVSFIIESITIEFVSMWFGFGALFGLLFAAIGVPVHWQIVATVIPALLSLIFLRKLTLKLLRKDTIKTNVDALSGTKARLQTKITFESPGTLKMGDVVWEAQSENQVEIEEGTIVEIVKVKGNKLIVKKVEEAKIETVAEEVPVAKPETKKPAAPKPVALKTQTGAAKTTTSKTSAAKSVATKKSATKTQNGTAKKPTTKKQ